MRHRAEEYFDGIAADPLAVLRGILDSRTPEELKGLVGRVMRRSEWKAAGFDTAQDEYGNYAPFMAGAVSFRLREINSLTDRQLAAARRGGRDLSSVHDIEWFIRLGGDQRELIDVPDHVKAVILAHDAPDAAQRIAHLAEAVRLAPEEVRYREEWYAARVACGDTTAIDEALQYFRDDIDVVVHSGTAEAWLKLLLESTGIAAAESLDQSLRDGLTRIERAAPSGRRYGGWAPWFVSSKKEELEKIWKRVVTPPRPTRKARLK